MVVHEVTQWHEHPWANETEHEDQDKWLLLESGICVQEALKRVDLHMYTLPLIHGLGCTTRPPLSILSFCLTAFVFAFKQVFLQPSEREANG